MTFPMSTQKVKGTGYEALYMPTKDPRQMELYNQVSQALGPFLGKSISGLGQLAGGDQAAFQGLEAPAMRQYQQLLGDIGARYSGMGMGAQRSSAFQNQLTGAAGDLAERLQSQRLSLQQNAIQQLLGLYGNLIGTDLYDTQLIPRKQGFLREFGVGMAPGIGQALGYLPFM